MLRCSSTALLSAAAYRCTCQLLGSARLVPVPQGSLLHHIRSIASPARQTQFEPDVPVTRSPRLQSTAQQQPQPAPETVNNMTGNVPVIQVVSPQHTPAQQTAQPTAAAVPTSVLPRQPVSPTGIKRTFYKRKLPCPPATEFSSLEGRLLFAEALQQGTMSGFFKLIEQYSTQDEPAFCGLASLAMVLNALCIDPKRPWKGSWRWFHEELLDCCLPLDKVAQEGVVLTQAACLAKCNGANVSLNNSGTFSLEEFRQAVIDTCTTGEEHLVVSYTRKTFGQTGDGHFSPIGGYHGDRDLVLILDTARFKYPPHWVPLPMLFEAMGAIDPTTGQPRGYLRLSANAQPDSALFTLDLHPDSSWRPAQSFIQATAPQLVQAAAAAGEAMPEELLRQLVALVPLQSVASFIAVRLAADCCERERCVPRSVRQQVLRELCSTPLHQAIQPLLAQHLEQQQQPMQQQTEHSYLSEKLTMLLLLQEPNVWGAEDVWANPQQQQAWRHLLDASAVSILEGEVTYLRQQLQHIEDVLLESSYGSGAGSRSCSSCSGAKH